MFRLFRRTQASAAAPAPAPGARFRAAPSVTCTRDGGRTVLLDHRAGEFYGLDEVATRLWELLGGGATLAEAVDALEAEYEAPREVLERDAAALAARLVSLGVLEAA
ncbi:MAG TPA: PqqD family protein [Longimicrobium sp.]